MAQPKQERDLPGHEYLSVSLLIVINLWFFPENIYITKNLSRKLLNLKTLNMFYLFEIHLKTSRLIQYRNCSNEDVLLIIKFSMLIFICKGNWMTGALDTESQSAVNRGSQLVECEAAIQIILISQC